MSKLSNIKLVAKQPTAHVTKEKREREAEIEEKRKAGQNEGLTYNHALLMQQVGVCITQQQWQALIDLLSPYAEAAAQQTPTHYAEFSYYLATAYYMCGKWQAAVDWHRIALSVVGASLVNVISSWQQVAHACRQLGALEQAINAYEQLINLQPEGAWSVALLNTLAQLKHTRNLVCDWTDAQALSQRIETLLLNGGALVGETVVADPYISSHAKLLGARHWAQGHVQQARAVQCTIQPAALPKLLPATPTRCAGKLVVGFIGADFYQQATSYLLIDAIEQHDKTQFVYIAYDTEANPPNDAMFKRCMAAYDVYYNVANLDDVALAKKIADDGVHVLINMKDPQHTRNAVFALRPARIQINYLYYPHSSGAPFFDYFVGDAVTTPDTLQPLFSEKIVRIEGCYQPNDSKRQLPRAGQRSEWGWQADDIILANFNQNYKYTPDMFAAWCRILNQVPKAKLALMARSTHAMHNLTQYAQQQGVHPDRLVFGDKVGAIAHLTRLSLADMVLDTHPYGGHTLTSDALWAGTPVLTLMGEQFASRVAASLLQSVGLTAWVTQSLPEYEATAVAFLQQPEYLQRVKQQLQQHRTHYELFNGALYARRFEQLLLGLVSATQGV